MTLWELGDGQGGLAVIIHGHKEADTICLIELNPTDRAVIISIEIMASLAAAKYAEHMLSIQPKQRRWPYRACRFNRSNAGLVCSLLPGCCRHS